MARAEGFQKEGYLTWESLKKTGQYFFGGGGVYYIREPLVLKVPA